MNPANVLRRANVREALVLGGLLAAILLSAIVISINIYTQLESAARLQRVLIVAARQLDDIVNMQLEQETSLRGYLATSSPLFLEPYTRDLEAYPRALQAFSETTKGMGLADMRSSIDRMQRLHDGWTADVAEPLLRHPHAKNAIALQTLGKFRIDQLRSDTNRIRDILSGQLAAAQSQLRSRIDFALLGGLASITVFGFVSILFVSSRVQMKAAIDRERSIVEMLEGAFRTDLDVLPGSRIGTAYLSADLDAAVGGDLYDVRHLDPTHGLVLVADVSGKGISAAVNTAFVKYSVRTLAREHRDPADLLDNFNAIFLETVSDPNLFVVAFVGVLDAVATTLTYASAGHAGAFLRRGDDVRALAVTGPVIGLGKESRYEAAVVPLRRGDLLLLATDGLTEARDGAGVFLDEVGAMDLLRGTSLDPQTCADEMVAAVRARSGGTVQDDLALLAIAIDGRTT